MNVLKLKYTGPLVLGVEGAPKTWTIMSHWLGKDGADYYHSTRTLEGLKEMGAIQ